MGELAMTSVDIVDIRNDKSDRSLLEMVKRSLQPENGGPASLPTLLLYNERGLKLFEKITFLEEYYLTNAEIEALTQNAEAIALRIPAGTRLVELGSGNLRKVSIVINALEKARKPIEYFALDLSHDELRRTFAEFDVSEYKYVSFKALHGTYDDGLAWLASPENRQKPTCVMHLGSSLGNFTRKEAASFLASIKNVLNPSDYLLVGIDSCQQPDRVHAAYNDHAGITEQFYRNGLDHVNELLNDSIFRQEDWAVEGTYDEEDNKHTANFVCVSDTNILGHAFHSGDKIHLENAYKYSEAQLDTLWHEAGVIAQSSFGTNDRQYFVHLLSPSKVKFANDPQLYASNPVPSLEDWQQLWSAWDTTTRSMVPRDELMNKPIKLRNNLIFYLGHIPTFADIHYQRATGAAPTSPAQYATIFERGIDPDVDDPEKCHDHSIIPDEWPPLAEILDYAARVRSRITESIKSGSAESDKKLGRSLWLAFEHEALHLETFLYMLLQSDRILPPPGGRIPDFGALARDANLKRELNKWHKIPEADVEIGIDDPEYDLLPNRYFGWDNERPSRMVRVPAFEAQSRCISNGDFAKYLSVNNIYTLPASWVEVAEQNRLVPVSDCPRCVFPSSTTDELADPDQDFIEGKAIRTVYGLLPLGAALDWPVMASYDELAGYAKWAQGRIPTFEEARSIYTWVEARNKREAEQVSCTLISAVNGHLSNNGVRETPPKDRLSSQNDHPQVQPDPTKIFIDLTGCNVAFKSWHPVSVTSDGGRLRGQSDAGGLWEWTSSALAEYDGFKPMDLYPGYTSDFFDSKHNICLGGSWATVPRIAGRKSFVNWYQRNYPYTWATARLVRPAT